MSPSSCDRDACEGRHAGGGSEEFERPVVPRRGEDDAVPAQIGSGVKGDDTSSAPCQGSHKLQPQVSGRFPNGHWSGADCETIISTSAAIQCPVDTSAVAKGEADASSAGDGDDSAEGVELQGRDGRPRDRGNDDFGQRDQRKHVVDDGGCDGDAVQRLDQLSLEPEPVSLGAPHPDMLRRLRAEYASVWNDATVTHGGTDASMRRFGKVTFRRVLARVSQCDREPHHEGDALNDQEVVTMW
ncbi:hypothetical protein CMEL01_16769 [Colletotrichum melonis]|uniref:Uncharacterized protein n=1 Tax=Colletotrichum melonis TaxID=1209925 RepID=A0AAI9XJ91_9PEZI|nr:hypothetical protein CMEL01_16769 [Colletotrichum melonis]